MHRCVAALLSFRPGFLTSSPAISGLQAVNFGAGRCNRRVKIRTKAKVVVALEAMPQRVRRSCPERGLDWYQQLDAPTSMLSPRNLVFTNVTAGPAIHSRRHTLTCS